MPWLTGRSNCWRESLTLERQIWSWAWSKCSCFSMISAAWSTKKTKRTFTTKTSKRRRTKIKTKTKTKTSSIMLPRLIQFRTCSRSKTQGKMRTRWATITIRPSLSLQPMQKEMISLPLRVEIISFKKTTTPQYSFHRSKMTCFQLKI